MFVFAQLSTSVSDDQIRLIIIALLVVAVLLAALTIWFFVKTSPSRRVRAAQSRRQGAAAGPGRNPEMQRTGPTRAAARPTEQTAVRRPDPVMSPVDDDDEWDRLTAPEPRRQAGN